MLQLTVVLICISLVTFEIEHFRKDFIFGHVNAPLDFTHKASRRVFERGVGANIGIVSSSQLPGLTSHSKAACGPFRQQVCHFRKIGGLPLRA